MRDYVEDESHRLEGELCRLRPRFDNLAYECDAMGESALLNYAEEASDLLRECITVLRRIYREC